MPKVKKLNKSQKWTLCIIHSRQTEPGRPKNGFVFHGPEPDYSNIRDAWELEKRGLIEFGKRPADPNLIRDWGTSFSAKTTPEGDKIVKSINACYHESHK